MSYLRFLCLFAYSGVQDILWFFPSCIPYVASFSGLFVFNGPWVFSNVYLNINNPIDLFHICHIEGYMFKLFSCLSGTHLSSNVRLSIVSLSRFVKKLEKQIF